MRIDIEWLFFLKVTTQQKCDKVLANISKASGFTLSDLKTERYWKDQSMFKVSARSSFEEPTQKDAFYTIMAKLGRLARQWVVNAPAEDGSWELGGVTNPGSNCIQGVDSISFASSSQIDAQNQSRLVASN